MNEKLQRLDYLVTQLTTQESRAQALYQAYTRRIVEYPEFYERVIHSCTDAKLFSLAAKIAKNNGDIERAITIYLQGGDVHFAADIALENNDIARAIEILASHGIKKKAADIALKYGMIPTAIKLYEELKIHIIAAEIAVKSGLTEEAFAILERGGNFAKASSLAEQIGDVARAQRYGELAIKYLAMDHHLREIVGETIDPKVKTIEDARKASENGNYRVAGELWESVDEFGQAAEAFLKAKDYRRAAISFEKWQFLPYAAENFERVNDFGNAALNYEKSGHFRDAANCYKRARDEEKSRICNSLADLLEGRKPKKKLRFWRK